MNDSILNSIKKLLGLSEEYTPFDPDIIMHINTALSVLHQIGIGPAEGCFITDANNVWSEIIPAGDPRYNMVVTLIYQKVKLMFDPPVTSSHIDALKSSISELEWRLSIIRN